MHFETKDFTFLKGDAPVSIVEIGVNHNGDIDLAKQMVRSIRASGGDVVKFQAFIASEEISKHAEKAEYQKETTGGESNQLEMASKLELNNDQLRTMRAFCHDEEMPFLCTAFESKSLDFLINDLGMKSLKIASSEVTHHPFLAEMARTGAGLILSTGASTLEETAAAVRVIQEVGDNELILLHCVSEYPAKMSEINLSAMETMRRAFGLPVGYSDHTSGIAAPIAACALGACAIEKHFTLDRNMEGPDHRASIEVDELEQMVLGMHAAHVSIGDGIKVPVACEIPQIPLIRKAIVARESLPVGHVLRYEDLAFKRPRNGIEPFDLDRVLGRALRNPMEPDQPLQWSDI